MTDLAAAWLGFLQKIPTFLSSHPQKMHKNEVLDWCGAIGLGEWLDISPFAAILNGIGLVYQTGAKK
jgi:hypothetical protein